MNLKSRIEYAFKNPGNAAAAILRRAIGPLRDISTEIFAWLLRRRGLDDAVWRALRADRRWTPYRNLAVASETMRRIRMISDPLGENRYLRHRWRMIFNEIRDLTSKDVDWRVGPVFLSFGAGDRNPIGLPLLAVLAGAAKGLVIEPGQLRTEVATATLQETLWDVVRDPGAYGLYAADLGRLREALDADALWRGEALRDVLAKGRIELMTTPGESAALADESIDLVYSRSVLEHVLQIEAAMARLVRALRPGGIMFHDISLDAHDASDPISFYYAPRGQGADAYSGLNFWRLGDYVALFESLGCSVEIVWTETIAPSLIDRARLVPRFANRTDDDLRTTRAKLLVRKPRE
ncbi:MAG: methyltransferase domain-containing protein [Alphaproteobacteria bacterium]|nr:methyltransferase domain-containing protein [Alphaproteobacteria bacterium]